MYPRAVLNGDYRIISLLCGLAGVHKKRYVFPSQEWILTKLSKFYARSMSRSTLCRHMAALERDGYLKRTKRHTSDKQGGILFRSTLYQITRKSLRFARYMTACVGLGGPKDPSNPHPKPCATSDTISIPLSKDYVKGPGLSRAPPSDPSSLTLISDCLREIKAKLKS